MKPFVLGVGMIAINTVWFDTLARTADTVSDRFDSNYLATTLQMQAEMHKFDLNNFA